MDMQLSHTGMLGDQVPCGQCQSSSHYNKKCLPQLQGTSGECQIHIGFALSSNGSCQSSLITYFIGDIANHFGTVCNPHFLTYNAQNLHNA